MNREIITYTGKVFDFLAPKPEAICIEDIAHTLALTSRFGGHTRTFYSVAEHCVRASYLLVGDPLLNLMHDSAEAYIGDVISSQKDGLGWFDVNKHPPKIGWPLWYQHVEAEIMRNIGKALGIRALESWLASPRGVKAADLTMLATEIRDLMPPAEDGFYTEWTKGATPLPGRIIPWTWQKAETEFLHRYKGLRG